MAISQTGAAAQRHWNAAAAAAQPFSAISRRPVDRSCLQQPDLAYG